MLTSLTQHPTVGLTKNNGEIYNGRSNEFRQNISVLLFRSYELNVNLLGTK